jgi:hypothetical protein
MGGHHTSSTNITENDNVHIHGNFKGGISNFNNISASSKLMNLNTPVVWVNPSVGLCVEFEAILPQEALEAYTEYSKGTPLAAYPMTIGNCSASGYNVVGWDQPNTLGTNIFGPTFDTFYPSLI